ncbi:MAG: amidohydrolase [Salibacteraceae bacterium]
MKLNQVDKDLVKIRRHLHAHPELSEQEYETADKIVEFVARYHPTTIIEKVGGTGVLVVFDSGKKGATILFRAELDALPISEVNEFEYRSTVETVAHKCGHDGHATILIGLAKRLSERPFVNGKIVLLFQPAEENGVGAEAVLGDPKFVAINPDYVFAFHNLPGYPLHQVVVRNGSFTAAVKSIVIKIYGKTAHAAEPEHGANPALAIATILYKTDTLSNNQPEREDFAVITPIHIEMGNINYGISAGYGELRLTLRTWTEEQLDLLIQNIVQIIQSAAEAHQLKIEIESTHHFVANQNNTKAVDTIFQAAIDNQISVITRPYPFKWGEDFGLFTQHYKGAMFGIGAGEDTPALHNPDYDFPDAIIPTGVNLFYKIASKILSNS